MQCVPEMGSLRKEAASCHTAEPNDKGEKIMLIGSEQENSAVDLSK